MHGVFIVALRQIMQLMMYAFKIKIIENNMDLIGTLHAAGTWNFSGLRSEALLLHILNGRLLDNHEQSIAPLPQGR